jgi:hypothetical protein
MVRGSLIPSAATSPPPGSEVMKLIRFSNNDKSDISNEDETSYDKKCNATHLNVAI